MPNPPPGSMANLVPWVPGQSGNLLGRTRGLYRIAHRLRKATKDGKDLCDFLLGAMRDPAVPMRTRVQAAELILGYAYGKPREILELHDERPGLDRRALVAQLSPDERATLERLIDVALARAAPATTVVLETTATPVLSQGHDGPDADAT
jgi:hypothetical protein